MNSRRRFAVSTAFALALASAACTDTTKPSGTPGAGATVAASTREAAEPSRSECPAALPTDMVFLGDTPMSVEIERLGPPSKPAAVGDLVTLRPPRGASTLGTYAPTTLPLEPGRRHVFRLDDLRGRTYVSVDGGPEQLVAIAIRPDRFDVGLADRSGLDAEAIALDERIWHLGHRFAKCVDTTTEVGEIAIARDSVAGPWRVAAASSPKVSAEARPCWDAALAAMPAATRPETLRLARLGYGPLNTLQTFSEAEREGLLAIDLELARAHAQPDLAGLEEGALLSIRRSAPVVLDRTADPGSARPPLVTPNRGRVRLDGASLEDITLSPDTTVFELRNPAAGKTNAGTIPAGATLARLLVEEVALSKVGVLDLARWPALVHLELRAAPEESLHALSASTSRPPLASVVLHGFATVDLSWIETWPALESVVVVGGRVTGLPSKVGRGLRSVTLRDVDVDRSDWDRLAQHHPEVQWNDEAAEDIRTRFACATAVEVRNRVCDARNEDLRHRTAEPDEVATVITRLQPTGEHEYGAFACGGPSIDLLAGAERLGRIAIPTCDSAIVEGFSAMMTISTEPGGSICEWLTAQGVDVPAKARQP